MELGDFQESLPPFAKGGQGGLKAQTVMEEGSQSPLTPLLQRGGLVYSFLEYASIRECKACLAMAWTGKASLALPRHF